MDTHEQVARSWTLGWLDRTRRRPALAIRELNATIGSGTITLDVGKQFIRWGKTDIINPTDRFAPRDFLAVVDNEFLAATAVRLAYGSETNDAEFVWVPFFTPSRIPLYDQRWTALPPEAEGLSILDRGAQFPRTAQAGVRWNHRATGYEYSLSFYNGDNHLPLVEARVFPTFAPPAILALEQHFPRIRMGGGDVAWPLPWFTLKGEAGYFTSPDRDADEYLLYVIQLERQVGELSLIGGYAGEAIAVDRGGPGFAPDRGLTKAFLGKATYTIDPNRSVSAELAIKQTLDGEWLKGEYSRAVGNHWRVTIVGNLIRGQTDDFIGQYRRNSHVSLSARYSF